MLKIYSIHKTTNGFDMKQIFRASITILILTIVAPAKAFADSDYINFRYITSLLSHLDKINQYQAHVLAVDALK